MSKSKYTNLICMVIICLTVLVTVLFMYEGFQKAVSASSSDISEDSCFSRKDLDGSWSEEEATYIALGDTTEIDGTGASYENGKLYIAISGTYVFSGEQAGIQIVVNAQDGEIQLVLDGVDIAGTGEPAIYVEDAGHVYLTLAEGSENTVSIDGEWSGESEAEDLDAVIYSKCGLTVNGTGSLTVDSDMTESSAHGIKSTDDLIITGGVICANVSGNALAGRDSVRICGGTFDLTAGNDGIKSNNDNDEDKGYILITDGTFTIVSSGDGIQAETDLLIEGGTFDITAGGGSGSASAIQSDAAGISPNGGTDPGNADMGGRDFAGDGEDFTSSDGIGDFTPSDGMGDFTPSDGMEDFTPSDGMGDFAPSDDMGGAASDSDVKGMGGGRQGMKGIPDAGQDTDAEPESEQGTDAAGKDVQGTDAAGEDVQGTDAVREDVQETEDSSSCKGLKAGVSMTLCGGTFDVDCADDAVHSNGTVTISNGTFLLASGDDGIHADDILLVEGGEVTVAASYEGLEAEQIQITDGNIDITASDDGINASNGSSVTGFGMGSMPGRMSNAGGTDGAPDTENIPDTKNNTDSGDSAEPGDTADNEEFSDSSLPVLRITGGTIHVDAGGDGLDSNGNLIVEGGLIYVDGPTNSGNGSLDFGSESGGDCVIHGGTVLALGASGMEENFSDNSEQTSIHCDFTSGFGEGDELKITDAQGEILFEYTVNKSGNCVIFSSPELSEGETYTVLVGEQSEETTAGDNTSSNGMGMQNFRR